ncbi:MAG: sodium:calcium antiporter, partial [Bacteroidia bacterium]|nr:sodium:calcium antiporter [Bacteroidia bacterium]
MLSTIAGFLICAGIIFGAGKRLSHYGDLLAELSGLGRAWIGLVLMAAVTSLPELMVGISSAAVIQSADLAAGDILGSCAFNLGILSLMDLFTPKNKPLFSQISRSHTLAAAFGIILISLVGLNLFLSQDFQLTSFL